MGTRSLRQYYDEPIDVEIDTRLGPIVEPWMRHRRRFVDQLARLPEERWSEATRCDGWDVHDVACHLVSADGFWVLSVRGATAGNPTSMLVDFDPTAVPASIVAPMRSMATDAVLEQFTAATAAFIDTVSALDGEDWSVRGESPIGHVPLRLVLAHAFWDSWLHERDIFVPLGIDVPIETDELALATSYQLVMGAVQGGLLDDPTPVGPGPTEPLDVSLAFTDLPGRSVRLVVDQGARVEPGDDGAPEYGAAVDLVERYTGRSEIVPGLLPDELEAQLRRAIEIL